MRRRYKRKAEADFSISRLIKDVLGVVAIICCSIIIPGIAGWFETTYKMNGIVYSINNGIITLEDTSGNQWEVTDLDLEVGQKVSIIFFDNGTPNNRLDDEVRKVKEIK